MIDLRATPLHTALKALQEKTSSIDPAQTMTIFAADPDNCIGCYAGKRYELNDNLFTHHSWHSWTTLAHLLGCRMLTPKAQSDGTVEITFQKIDIQQTFHTNKGYGSKDLFSHIDKREEPSFIYFYTQALDEVNVCTRERILDLGINNGDELDLIGDMCSASADFVGIDLDNSALEKAKIKLPDATLHHHDINELDQLTLGRFDLIISIATLQSPGINTKKLIMNLIQNNLHNDGAVIFGFPNSRWIDGELIQGAKAPNYRFSEMSLLIKDIYWIKKYLQQHKYRVRIFGDTYLFLVATRINTHK